VSCFVHVPMQRMCHSYSLSNISNNTLRDKVATGSLFDAAIAFSFISSADVSLILIAFVIVIFLDGLPGQPRRFNVFMIENYKAE